MLSLYLACFCLLVALLFLVRRKTFLNHRLPPGPVGVPLLGYLPMLDVFNLGESFSRLADKFGDVFSLRVGTELAIVLNSYESVKAAFSMSQLCSRPDTFMFRFFSRGEHGIASASGELWEVQRKFVHKNLRAGGKAQMESFINEEVKDLLRLLEDKSEGGTAPVEIGYDINVAVVNILWAMLSGERRPHGDRQLRDFLQAVNKGIELASTSGILLFMPFLIRVLPERIFGVDLLRKWMDRSYGYLKEVVDQHKLTLDPTAAPRDFIDSFLLEMGKDAPHPSFNDFQLLVLCSELFGAGGEPTSVTLKWALRFLALNPEVQKRAQREIDAVVGRDRMITMEDRSELHYVQAMVYELIRFSDIHPIGVLHSPSEDVEIEGYHVPKGTFVFPNFHRIHRDPAHWERPDELYPGHWLDCNGSFTGGKRDGFLAFGVGKRKCPGQEVATMELFSFIANLLQKFSFRLTEGDDGTLESNPGVVVSPKPFSLMLEVRA